MNTRDAAWWLDFLHTHGEDEWAGGLLVESLLEDMEGVEGERDQLISDLAAAESRAVEAEREAGVLRDALAESERLREKAEAERGEWTISWGDAMERLDDSEEKVAALTALVAQSSTQYREMVDERDDYKAYYDANDGWASNEEMYQASGRIEARREAEEAARCTFTEGSDGIWTCSFYEGDWCMEADTPEANDYRYCPGCGKRITNYNRYCDDEPAERSTP